MSDSEEETDVRQAVASVSREGKSQVTPVIETKKGSRRGSKFDLSRLAKGIVQCAKALRHKPRPLLLPLSQDDILAGKKTLVLDLDETLVHTTFQPSEKSDFVVPIKMGKVEYRAYVFKRPGVDFFLQAVASKFELVVFTASIRQYADAVIDLLDPNHVISHRLFRDSCVPYAGAFVKDLSRLGRDLSKIIIIDNAPSAYMFQPNNALPCTSWFDDPDDDELIRMVKVLEVVNSFDNIPQIITSIMTHTRSIHGEDVTFPELPPVIEDQP
eukprot:c4906_g1_i1.p1 GENE.c4906_g1_i1~~c4906_g1_i1.p1  ORF type:complete len:270 (+),score=38.78 c4906_g1_i1:48-857(+)